MAESRDIVGVVAAAGRRGPASRRPGAFVAAAGRIPWGRADLCPLLLASLLLASVALVDPRGEFPLNDDWSFVGSVRTLVTDHDWRPLGWASMTQITHALLGFAVCSVSSCSFEALRGATLLAGLVLLLSTFRLFARVGASRLAGALVACCTLFNPVLYPLAYTFMTDVVFALLMVASAAACTATLRTERWRYVLASTALLILATLSRQLGIAMAAAILPVYLLSSRERLAPRAVKAGLPLAASAAALLLYEHWMRQTGRLPALYDGKYADLLARLARPGHLAAQAVETLLLAGLYLGLLCLPVLLLRSVRRPGERWRTLLAGPAGRWASFLCVAVVGSMTLNRALMPLLGNVLGKAGVGPFTLRDTYILGLGLDHVPALPVAFWAGVTGLSLLGFWLLVFRVLSLLGEAWPEVKRGRLGPSRAVPLFGVATTALYLVPLLLLGDVYDRYVAVMVPVLCLALVAVEPGARRDGGRVPALLACLCAAGLGTMAVLATHDYLAWNRARWAAIAGVEAAHEAGPATLDGGFEYNGYHAYDPLYVGEASKSWWWVADDAVQIAFGSLPGTEVVRRLPYATWFPPDTRFIYVLRRAAPTAAAPPD